MKPPESDALDDAGPIAPLYAAIHTHVNVVNFSARAYTD